MTPFFNGWITRISGGVRPIIALASLPTARIERSSSRIETIEGSLTTMPSPWTNTSVFDVPRSMATFLENLRKNIRPLSAMFAKTRPRRLRQQGSGGSRQPGRNFCGLREVRSVSARGGAHGVEELSSRERLVEKRGAGGPERLVRLFAAGAGRDEDEPVADGGPAGRDLSQELEPVDAVQIEVRDDQIEPFVVTKGSKIFGRTSAGIPGPVSSREIRTRSGLSARVVTLSLRWLSGCSAIACLAFVTRLTRTC